MNQLYSFSVNHWQACLALLIVLVFIAINELWDQKKRGTALAPQQVIDWINNNDAAVVDLRNLELYKAGHITAAVHAGADDFQEARLKKFKNKPLILVCVNGVSSAALAPKLKAQGFEHVMVLAGGITAWQEANLPLIKKG